MAPPCIKLDTKYCRLWYSLLLAVSKEYCRRW